MNDKLPPEVRVKVAGECAPDMDWRIWRWEPERHSPHKVALHRTAARLIEELPTVTPSDSQRKRLYLYQSNTAIATNDTDALEGIVAELRGFV